MCPRLLRQYAGPGPESGSVRRAVPVSGTGPAPGLLFKTAGGNALRRGNPVERAWRDAHAGSVHVANDVERALAMYGRGAFGLTVEDNLV
ncbi:hypothetical protein [Streptomyces brevispora]|uniref:Acyl-CoA dehydrogenase-like protein n=1 Tax=Streptomyces brevispora TaxID=887462 RepID=A0A561UQS6_9ACTN|nr:hypothetical protein [Streptomyces brevispora]TWG01705.1 acyl-CoA dehydrogenase-like protein [Streptomyces brevispora]WSC17075.1 hypothetical protein OIE64_32445 [Streptomyces brevispora]